jgi:hypothetical protein
MLPKSAPIKMKHDKILVGIASHDHILKGVKVFPV